MALLSATPRFGHVVNLGGPLAQPRWSGDYPIRDAVEARAGLDAGRHGEAQRITWPDPSPYSMGGRSAGRTHSVPGAPRPVLPAPMWGCPGRPHIAATATTFGEAQTTGARERTGARLFTPTRLGLLSDRVRGTPGQRHAKPCIAVGPPQSAGQRLLHHHCVSGQISGHRPPGRSNTSPRLVLPDPQASNERAQRLPRNSASSCLGDPYSNGVGDRWVKCSVGVRRPHHDGGHGSRQHRRPHRLRPRLALDILAGHLPTVSLRNV